MAYRGRVAAAFAAGVMFAAAPAAAQNDDQKKLIAATMKERIEAQAGTALDPETAGYYQLMVTPQGFARDALCPDDRQERDRLASAANNIFTWALNKKKNWGASARIFFDRVSVDYDDPNLKPDAELRFFTVHQRGSDPKNCTVPMSNVSTVYSPLFPLLPGAEPPPVHVELVTWYNDQADQARIDLLPRIAGGLFGLAGLPPTLLDTAAAAAGTTPADEFKRLINTERTSKARTALYSRQAQYVGATAYLGLRDPVPTNVLTVKAKAVLTIRPISSIFSSTSPTFVSLAAQAPDQILNLNLASGGPPKYLYTVLGTIDHYNQMLTASSYEVLSNRCDSLDLHLQNQLKLSQVDSAVIVNAVARKIAGGNPALSDLRKIGCLTNANRAAALEKVGIELPPIVEGETGPPTKSPRMAKVMDGFAKLRGVPLESSGLLDWSAYRFPLTVYDSADRFAWENGRREFTADNIVELHKLLQERFTNIGCWAYFEDLPVVFASGMGDVGAGRDTPVRKSAALGRLSTGEVSVIQFRYGGGGDAARVTGVAFVPRDEMAKTRMLANSSCDKGDPARDWMQSFLRPAPVQAAAVPAPARGAGSPP